MRRMLTLLAGLVIVAAAVAPALAAGQTYVPAALPGTYLAGYARAQTCAELITPPWVSWDSYASATVGDEWLVTASATNNCTIARRTADAVIERAPNHDGTGQNLSDMIAFARHHRTATLSSGPEPAGGSWRCAVLPSFWSQQAEDLAVIAGQPGLPDGALEAAGGPAAGAGYCETGARRVGKGQWKGGQFFTWAPDTRKCQRHYTLKQVDDPGDPGSTTSPKFPAELWSDYDPVPCP